MKPSEEMKKRGRPKTGRALSSAERQKAYRDRKREEKVAILNSRNALQELPKDGSPRRILAELDRAQRTTEQLTQYNALLHSQLALVNQANACLKDQLRKAEDLIKNHNALRKLG
jgi:6-phosphogluconate dehydrogenase (decarboxylating)